MNKKESLGGNRGSKQKHTSLPILSYGPAGVKTKYVRGMAAEACREVHRRMRRYVEELCECYESRPEDIPAGIIYNEMPWRTVNMKAEPAMETRRQAEALFDAEIAKASCFKPYKLAQKQEYWVQLVHSLKQAKYARGTVLLPRNVHHPDFARIRLQVVEAAIERGLLWERRSPKGSPKTSRLFPLPMLQQLVEHDPWQFDPNHLTQYVFLKRRDDKSHLLSFESLMAKPSWHIAHDAQKKLTVINHINSLYEITHLHYSDWEQYWVGRRRLRPVHYAVFTGNWGWHGRLYTKKYGHQALRKIERSTIEFSGCPSVELDYGGMHARMLYHLEGIDYREDPYRLWGDNTTPALRLLAKTLVNAALSAQDRDAAISACNGSMKIYTDTPLRDAKGQIVRNRKGHILYERKTGDSLQKAQTLLDAYRQTGMTFNQIYDLAAERHQPIARHFGTDAGMWLMRIDSEIALGILYAFALRGIPCLSCHDSFIVPAEYEDSLRSLMETEYYDRTGFFPVVKPSIQPHIVTLSAKSY